MYRSRIAVVAVALFAAGCVTFPPGPSVMALPGSNRGFDEFRGDDNECRSFAANSIGGSNAQQAYMDSAAVSAVVGTVVGAAAGVAIGGGSGSAAAAGAGAGLLIGSAAGSGSATYSGFSMQQRYDIGYTQCMYAKGHKVPVSGEFASRNSGGSYSSRPRYAPPPAPGTYAPPPAPGTYAPPPASGSYAPPPTSGTYAPPPPR
jgi:outer membrane lipoprotein SlyB